MRLRTASLDDAAAIGAVLTASYSLLMRGAYPDDLLESALPRITRANPDLLRSGRYHLAESEDGAAMGCGGWSDRPPGSGPDGHAHIRHFATHPDWTGQGVGRAIYRRCEEEAAAAGFGGFICFSSLNGEPFYAALGFRRVREIRVPMGPGLRFPSVLMVKGIGDELPLPRGERAGVRGSER